MQCVYTVCICGGVACVGLCCAGTSLCVRAYADVSVCLSDRAVKGEFSSHSKF